MGTLGGVWLGAGREAGGKARVSNCLPGAANLAASGSPTDILHSLPRPRGALFLAYAYQHLHLTHASLSLLQQGGAPAHLTPSQTPTLSQPGIPSCGSSLPPLPHRISTTLDLQTQGKEFAALLRAFWVPVGSPNGA